MKSSMRKFAVILLLICGCAVKMHTVTPVVAEPVPGGNYIPPTIAKRDTMPARHKLSQMELLALIKPYYEPEVNKLKDVIKDQAMSIQGLTVSVDRLSFYLATNRKRADSIAKERNFWREAYQKGQRMQIAASKVQAENSQKQMAGMKQIINYLITGFVIVVVFLFILGVMVSFVWKRNNKIYKQVFPAA